MALLVPLKGDYYVCDVGFGGLTMTGPLLLTTDDEQRTPHETLRIAREGSEHMPQVKVHGEWRSLYSFDLQQQLQTDIEVLNFFVSQHPQSPFKSRLIAARREGSRTLKLSDAELTIQPLEGTRERRTLRSLRELRSVLGDLFQIDVPVDAALDAALSRLIA
jgi:N-hydroxyarylamine O-acetyltransferase